MNLSDYKFFELMRQVYAGNNAVISVGFVEGHPVDTLYLHFDRPGEENPYILMRRDEAAIISHMLTGLLWSDLMGDVKD